MRFCFLHDLFARIYLRRSQKNLTPFPQSIEELEKDVLEVIAEEYQ